METRGNPIRIAGVEKTWRHMGTISTMAGTHLGKAWL